MSVEGSVRERRRAETVQEIKAAALEQLAEGGPGGLSLRGVARAVGMTVQSLYHYFDSRDELLTALVIDGHRALAAAVAGAADASRGRPQAERLWAASNAYRQWALANRPAFLLLYGTPVPGYEPPSREEVITASVSLAEPFLDVVFDGWSAEQLAGLPLQPGAERLAEVDTAKVPLPVGALAVFYELRAQMHGLVMLELVGHLAPMNDHGEDLFRGMISRTAAELAALKGAV
ncbi:TetR/AcrR family transcriptional regulator [Pseudonocardia cypriaca]|uniref:TetR family transcriptional regulator n=1 Tax=Pseudonocardia cypriaca TaxID=882449 RepID=A0A543GEA4_9PSEU|nr:TetR/AcrR family transcriptional regulator [Pseudonocardia cypriaca]TQM44412.1 TetR family transcriptional regulator [Pseudonocardia cypriaca]